MFTVSTQLINQIAGWPKVFAILNRLYKKGWRNWLAKNGFPEMQQIRSEVTIEAWWTGLWVKIAKTPFRSGFCSLVSWDAVSDQLWYAGTVKGRRIEGQRLTVEDDSHFSCPALHSDRTWFQVVRPNNLSCNCWLFRCVSNRVFESRPQFDPEGNYLGRFAELPQLKAAMERSPLWTGSDRQGNPRTQFYCHHLYSAMSKHSGQWFSSFNEFLEAERLRKQEEAIDRHTQRERDRVAREAAKAKSDLFDWGTLSVNESGVPGELIPF